MKKILITLFTLFSFQVTAGCPTLEGDYLCLNFEGKPYKQTISSINIEGGLQYTFVSEKGSISWNVDGKQYQNYIVEDNKNKIKITYKGYCLNNNYINDFMMDDKVNVVRGSSVFKTFSRGYTQTNTIVYQNDKEHTSKEECKLLN